MASGFRAPVKSEQNYGPGVRIGNWFEDSCRYKRVPFERCSTYDTDYTEQTLEHCVKKSTVWNAKFKGEGCGSFHGKPVDDYSSCYDLMYRVYPKGLDGPRLRIFNVVHKQYESDQDLRNIHGNLTHFGLKGHLREIWKEQMDMSIPKTTVQASYCIPGRNDYAIKVKKQR